MKNNILILQPLYSFVVEEIIAKINEIPAEEDIDIILNSPGGSVFAGWTLAATIAEREGKVTIKVRGHAASMAPMLMLYGDDVEALDVTLFMLHRADYWNPSEEEKLLLADINKQMLAKLKAKIDDKKLKELKGINLKGIFEAEVRTDVWLTAKEAKQIGLIDKVVKLERKDIKAEAELFAAFYKETPPQASGEEIVKPNNNLKNVDMTLQELKKDHPELYAEVLAIGVNEEKDRAGAWLAFNDLDHEAVTKGISGGNAMTQTEMAEMSRKALDASIKKAIGDESAEEARTEDPKAVETEAEKKAKAFENEVNAELGIRKKEAN